MRDFERAYQEAKRNNPGASFAQITGNMIHESILKGGAHATLGANLLREGKWEDQGLKSFQRLCKFRKLSPGSRVIEYGCGSLRIGHHFINFLDAGNFIGLDVIDGFFEIGKKLIQPDILQQKQPYIAVIDQNSIEVAEKFQADFIYLAGVAIHVHDDDAPHFFANLRRIACKENSTLVLSAYIAERSFEHVETSWARPLEFYTGQLQGLRFVDFHASAARTSEHGDYQVGYLEFSRDYDL